jgi:hypothetical protein
LVIARAGAAAVAGRQGVAGSGAPQCVFSGGRLRVTVMLDSSPQPYTRLERAAVENAQQFGTKRLEAAPQSVTHLGLDAWWFPTEQQLQTTDGRTLVTVTVAWRRVAEARRRALARAMARLYLGPLDRAAAP